MRKGRGAYRLTRSWGARMWIGERASDVKMMFLPANRCKRYLTLNVQVWSNRTQQPNLWWLARDRGHCSANVFGRPDLVVGGTCERLVQ